MRKVVHNRNLRKRISMVQYLALFKEIWRFTKKCYDMKYKKLMQPLDFDSLFKVLVRQPNLSKITKKSLVEFLDSQGIHYVNK